MAALLTILGFSLYDTIIVFDRIRENVPRMPRATFSQIVNRSMSEVLTRSLATSFSTLLPVTALMLFGGETLRDFAFALMVGIASGAYSSIFIASPVLTLWKEREAVYVRRRKLVMEDHGGHVPPFATGTIGEEEQVAAGTGSDVATRRRRRGPGSPAARPATAGGPDPSQPSAPLPEEPQRGPEPSRTGVGGAEPSRPEASRTKPRAGEGEGEGDGQDASTGSRVSSTGGRSKPSGASSSRGRKKHGRR